MRGDDERLAGAGDGQQALRDARRIGGIEICRRLVSRMTSARA